MSNIDGKNDKEININFGMKTAAATSIFSSNHSNIAHAMTLVEKLKSFQVLTSKVVKKRFF